MRNQLWEEKLFLFFNILIFKIIVIYYFFLEFRYTIIDPVFNTDKKWKRCLILIVHSFSLIIFGGFITNCRYSYS